MFKDTRLSGATPRPSHLGTLPRPLPRLRVQHLLLLQRGGEGCIGGLVHRLAVEAAPRAPDRPRQGWASDHLNARLVGGAVATSVPRSACAPTGDPGLGRRWRWCGRGGRAPRKPGRGGECRRVSSSSRSRRGGRSWCRGGPRRRDGGWRGRSRCPRRRWRGGRGAG